MIYRRVVSGLFGSLSYLVFSPVSRLHVHFQIHSFPFFEALLWNFSWYNWRHIIYFTTSQFPRYDRRQLVRKGMKTIKHCIGFCEFFGEFLGSHTLGIERKIFLHYILRYFRIRSQAVSINMAVEEWFISSNHQKCPTIDKSWKIKKCISASLSVLLCLLVVIS